jgi:hypothetical protein
MLMACSCASVKNPHYIIFEESKGNVAYKPIQHLLIVGAGKLPTRFFLDEMSNQLVKDLKQKGIAAQYYFLGSDSVTAKNKFSLLLSKNDSVPVMTFFETDFAFVRPIYDHYYVPAPVALVVIKVKDVRYSQGFTLDLFVPSATPNIGWSSNLDINYNFRDPGLYTSISSQVLKSLKKNNFVN